MKGLGTIALVIGAASLVIGILLRILAKPITLGLVPSSFLELSVACFLLTLALDAISKK